MRLYEIWKLLKYELAPASLYLTKDNKLRKPDKHELTNLLEVKLEVLSLKYIPVNDKKMAVFFDFIAYARKVATDKLKTFGDFVASLWKTISLLSKDAQCIDFVYILFIFSLYLCLWFIFRKYSKIWGKKSSPKDNSNQCFNRKRQSTLTSNHG